MRVDQLDEAPPDADVAGFFDLDVRVVETGPAVNSKKDSTDNGCTSTCPNACSGTGMAQRG